MWVSSHHEGSTIDKIMDDGMTYWEAKCQPAERQRGPLERYPGSFGDPL